MSFNWRGVSCEAASPAPVASASVSAFAELPALEVELSVVPTASPRVGDRLELKALGAPVTSGVQLQIPPGSSTLAEQGWAIFIESSQGGGVSEAFRFVAVPLKVGELILPSLALVDAQGKPFARTHPFKISVVSAISPSDPKPQEPEPPRPPVSLPYPWWVMILLGFVGLVFILLGIYLLIRWSRARQKNLPATPVASVSLSEDEEALAALDELESQGVARQGDFKKHYFRLSEVLKAYIGARYGFDAPESTSREILGELKRQRADRLRPPGMEGGNLDESGMDRLEKLLEKLDLVKFTDYVPPIGEPFEVLTEAKAFVLATRRAKAGMSNPTIQGLYQGL